ncbi:MAG: hypothetical protein ABEJ80_02620 [Halarchaeum sp.]
MSDPLSRPNRPLLRRPSRPSLGAVVVGVAAGVASVATADTGYVAADVSVALALAGVVGVVAGALNHVLDSPVSTPNAVPASVHGALADLAARTLDASDARAVYVPRPDGPPALFVPDDADATAALPTPDGTPGTVVRASGSGLLAATDAMRTSNPPTDAETALAHATDAAERGLSLADSVAVRDVDAGRATVVASGVRAGDPTAYDHPLGSLLSLSLADTMDAPVSLDADGDAEAVTLTYRWRT